MEIDFVLANYVYALAALPDRPGVLLTTNNEKKLFKGDRYRYKAISLWLRHLLLGQVLAEECLITDAKHYQPLAEFVAAEFRLAVGVHPRSANPLIRSFESPAELWFCSQWIMSQQNLEDSGLVTSVPKLQGKRAELNKSLQVVKRLEDLSIAYQLDTSVENLSGILLMEAQEIAKTDIDFQKDYLRPHLRVMKRTSNKLKNSKALQTGYLLPSGELFWNDKDRKLPKKM